ncbi:transcription initiation factor IID, 31kD subunit-domain-containing protein [Spinellus fusiger]|nr:transcription initiation factor IID, 31kD subunit-domain-containing protein [Spinellus fusiger]
MALESHAKQTRPRDARIIALILQSLGVEDYDPKVVHQLLEFAHRYTTDVFQDALVYAEHAAKADVDLEDIQLAIQGRVNHSFTTPPPKEFLLELAQEKNKTPLPLIPEKYGIRLPAEKHCLTGLHFSIVPDAPSRLSADTALESPHLGAMEEEEEATETKTKRSRDRVEDDDYDF